jgi:hypothetical protein
MGLRTGKIRHRPIQTFAPPTSIEHLISLEKYKDKDGRDDWI